jgi:XTP/dITP diphosphohydrolase
MRDLKDFNLATSNAVKIQQYHAFGLSDCKSKEVDDVPEPFTDILHVALYKAQQAGPFTIVEDTALDVEGEDIGVCIKYLEHTLDQYAGKRAKFQVALGVNDGNKVDVYYAETPGIIVKNKFSDAYGFDGNFIPDGETLTIHELLKNNEGFRISTRRKAVEELLKDDITLTGSSEKQVWDGEFQEEYLSNRNSVDTIKL